MHLFIYNLTFGQRDFNALDSILEYETSLSYKKKKIDSLLHITAKKNIKDLTFVISIYFYQNQNYTDALFYGNLNLKSIRDQKNIDSLPYRRSLCNMGLFHYQNKSFDLSENYYKSVLLQNKIDKYQGRAAYRLGVIHQENGDYYTALSYYKMAKNSYFESSYTKGEIESSIKIAEIYESLNGKLNLEKGRKILLDILNSKRIATIDEIYLQDIHLILGNLYDQEFLGDKNKSEKHYLKSLEIAKIRGDEFFETGIYNNLGNLYLKHDLEKAYSYLSNGLKHSNSNWVKAIFLHNLGIYYFKAKNYEKAIECIELSITKYLNLDKTSSIASVPEIELESSLYKNYILDAYVFLIGYKNMHKKTKKELNTIYKDIDIAERLIDYIRFEIEDQKSRLYWQKQASKIYQNATKTAFLTNNPEKAFHFMEKNKAVLLLKDIKDRELKKHANLPNDILKKEEQLKNNIYQLQDAYVFNEISKKDSIHDILFNSKIIYHNFIDSLKVDYPKYYNYKTLTKITSLKELQNSLTKEQLIIEYILNEENGYGLLIEKEATTFFELEDISLLNKYILEFKSKIRSPFITKKDFESYKELAFLLFQKLFPFNNASKYIFNKKITIIPDDNLQNFPFEALIISKKELASESYLITSAEINYAYSISFLKENQNISRNSTTNFTGFAPVYFTYDNQLTALKRSENEIIDAENFFSGHLFTKNNATKDTFLQNTHDSKIIHLSTHANATDSIIPWVAFGDKKMSLNELYTTKNNAELVVLSACNSAQGTLNKGEGVMSLARGFFYTGANSVICSLWNVDDKSGQYITTNFYKHLKKGNTKSKALHLAKLEYLKNHSLSETSPYYWSSLILIGDAGSINTSSYLWVWFLIIGSLVFIIFLWWLKKRK
ncbi:hypothetical protein GCM10007384_12210 [Aquimarina muelleri]|uniref:CHAT domain-containing protein n=1 Tax=Aquimarina muelleri TaxID=279356 RepID=A0A918JTK8_9FLAO|nr:hypothetical protein GCM10007384_12210 [Aquimarina muelleri]